MQQNVYHNPTDESGEEINIDFKKIWMILWSRKDIIIKVFLGILVFFIIMTFVQPKKYKVESDIYINKSNNTNLVDINPYAIEELGTGGGMAALMSGSSGNLTDELEIMQSPLVIDKVIRDNDLKIKKKWGIIPNRKEGEYISTKAFLKKNISIENKKGTNVVTIEYKAKKPDLAYNVVCSIISNYIEVSKQLHSEKARSDTKVLETEYNKVKADLNKQIQKTQGLPQTAITGTGSLAAMSAFSKSAGMAISSIQSQYASGAKSQAELQEETQKMTQIATKLQWAKMVEEMSDSSKVLVIKEPVPLRDFEYASPKLLTNIILGIIFGVIASLFAVICLELTDKKLSYSKLGDSIIYNDKRSIFNIQKFLVYHKNRDITCIVFDNPNQNIINLLSEFKNLNIVKATISTGFVDCIEQNNSVILLSRIGQTDVEMYKSTKEALKIYNKQILTEILI